MEEAVINIVLQQGPFAALFVWLLFSTKKEGRENVKPDWFSNCSRCMAKELRVVPKYTYSTGYRNANLFGGDFLEAGKLAFIEATAAIGIHSGLKKLPLDFPVVLDIETTKGLKAPQITAFCLAFLTHIKARTDKTPILYTGASFAKTHLGKELAGFPLWVADYGTNQPMGNPIWSRWAVFQHSDCGKVAGIKGNVDMNWMEKDFWNANMKGKQLWIKC